jgi:hypothetical protein
LPPSPRSNRAKAKVHFHAISLIQHPGKQISSHGLFPTFEKSMFCIRFSSFSMLHQNMWYWPGPKALGGVEETSTCKEKEKDE